MNTVFLRKVLPSVVLCFFNTQDALALKHKVSIKSSLLSFAENNNSEARNHVDLNLNYKFENEFSKKLKFKTEVQGYFATYPDFMFTVPVLELVYKNKENSFRLGRTKVSEGAYLDTDWVMGVQSSFSRMNPLEPEIQGVAGLSYQYESDQVLVNLYGSPISVPDQGAALDISSSGAVTSSNPWASLPPSRVRLSTGAELDLDYEIIDDSVPELLGAYQFGGSIGVKTNRLDIYGMYSNRPSKQLGFELDAKLQADSEGLVEVLTKPVFRREHFFGVQAESRWSDSITLKNGFYGLVLIDDESTADYQTSNPDYFFITTSLDLDLKSYSLSIKHLYSKERENEKSGVLLIDSSRFLYNDAFRLSLKRLSFRAIGVGADLTYLYGERVAQFSLKGNYSLSPKMSVFGALNLIEDFNDSDSSLDEDLSISSGLRGYAFLDYFRLGASYVF